MVIDQQLIHLVSSALGWWGYVIVFMAIALENIPIVGFFIPGGIITMAAGFFAKGGILNFGELFVFAFLGAIVGDLIGYILGRQFGYSFLRSYGKYFYLPEETLEKTRSLVNKHLIKTLLLGRFNPVTRTLMSFLAGVSHVRFLKVFTVNFFGAFLWVSVHLGIGYIFGQSYEIIAPFVGTAFLLAFVAAILIIYAYKSIYRNREILFRYHLPVITLNILSLYIFSELTERILTHTGWLIQLDEQVNLFVEKLYNPFTVEIFKIFTHLGGPIVTFILSAIFCISLIYYKKLFHLFVTLSALLVGAFSELVIKIIFHTMRPANSLIAASGFSFPSGHTLMATILFLSIFYSYRKDITKNWERIVFMIFTILIIVGVGFSMIYLRAQWLSDVLGGISLGVFLLTFFILAFNLLKHLERKFLPFLYRLMVSKSSDYKEGKEII